MGFKDEAVISGGWERTITFLNGGNIEISLEALKYYKENGLHYNGLHAGIDLTYSLATFYQKVNIPIYATHDGMLNTYIKNGLKIGFITDYSNNFRTVYAHLKEFNINGKTLEKGAVGVKMGQVIGYMRKFGADFIHLHYELQYNPSYTFSPEFEKIYGPFPKRVSMYEIGWHSINPIFYNNKKIKVKTSSPTKYPQYEPSAIADSHYPKLVKYIDNFKNPVYDKEKISSEASKYIKPSSELSNWITDLKKQ